MFHFFSNIQNRISFKLINFIILNYRSKRSTKEVDSLDHIQNQILLKLDPRRFFTLDSKRVNTASCNSKKWISHETYMTYKIYHVVPCSNHYEASKT